MNCWENSESNVLLCFAVFDVMFLVLCFIFCYVVFLSFVLWPVADLLC